MLEVPVHERRLGPYRLVEQIAVGGMAEIYLARTRGVAGFEKHIALKVILPNFARDRQFVQMLVDEAKLLVQLQHANIAQIFDFGQVDDTYYIAMEYVDGSDLFRLLQRTSDSETPFPLDLCAYIAREVCHALAYAHNKRDDQGRPMRIIHRDISPQNVLLSRSGEVKLVDFGIAKAASRVQKTGAGIIKGKYNYMSPEQAWGDPVDARSDLFSCGILLHEMISGQMVYPEDNMFKLLQLVRKADIAPPSKYRADVPPELESIVMRALARKPNDRMQSAQEFAMLLDNFLFARAPTASAARLGRFVTDAIDRAKTPATPDENRPAILSRDEYRPDREHSLLFKLAAIPSDHAGQEPTRPDRDFPEDETVVTGPPLSLSMRRPEPVVSRAPRLYDAEEAPTLRRRALPAEPLPAPPAAPTLEMRRRPSRLWWVALVGGLVGLLVVAVMRHLPSPPPRLGRLTIISVPPGARVRLEHGGVQRTPAVLAGLDRTRRHHLTFELEGYKPKAQEVSFEGTEDEKQIISVLEADTGMLRVESTPPGAEIYLDGRAAAVTPAIIRDVPFPKDITIELRLRGYRAYREVLQWNGQRELERRIVFSPRREARTNQEAPRSSGRNSTSR